MPDDENDNELSGCSIAVGGFWQFMGCLLVLGIPFAAFASLAWVVFPDVPLRQACSNLFWGSLKLMGYSLLVSVVGAGGIIGGLKAREGLEQRRNKKWRDAMRKTDADA